MDLINTWQEIQREKFDSLIINKEEIMETIHMDSNSTISQLKIRLSYKRNWIIFFLMAFTIWGMFSIDNAQILSIIGVIIMIYGIGLVAINKYLQQMDDGLDFSDQTLSIMKRNYQLISKALQFENIWTVISLPLAVIIGAVIAQTYQGLTNAEMLHNVKLLRIVIIAAVTLVPLGYFGAKKMNQHAFSGLLDQLKRNIHQMEVVQ